MGIEAALIGTGLLGAYTANKSSKAQTSAADQSSDLQRDMFDQQVELSRPWREAGEQALNKLLPMATEYTPFGMAQFQADPGYSFRMSEGMKGLERSAAARGGLLSGATLKGIQRYGQDLGSQEYQNAFNRYQAERAARLDPLQSLAGVGQTTAQQIGDAGMRTAANIGETQMSGAAARGSGYVGSSNALTGALGQYLNYSQNQNIMKSLGWG